MSINELKAAIEVSELALKIAPKELKPEVQFRLYQLRAELREKIAVSLQRIIEVTALRQIDREVQQSYGKQ